MKLITCLPDCPILLYTQFHQKKLIFDELERQMNFKKAAKMLVKAIPVVLASLTGCASLDVPESYEPVAPKEFKPGPQNIKYNCVWPESHDITYVAPRGDIYQVTPESPHTAHIKALIQSVFITASYDDSRTIDFYRDKATYLGIQIESVKPSSSWVATPAQNDYLNAQKYDFAAAAGMALQATYKVRSWMPQYICPQNLLIP
jgi:hypothetical protein